MRKIGWLLLWLSGMVLPVEAGTVSLTPLPFRDYGYFVGDRFDRCWQLMGSSDVGIVRPQLPRSLGRWVVIRGVRLEGDRLCVEYQVDYAPFTTETVSIPAWRVTLRFPEGRQSVTLPAATVTLAPLRPIQSLKGEAFMQPEVLPPLRRDDEMGYLWTGGVLLFVGVAALVWHLWGGDRRVRWPFCRAWMAMAKLADDEAGRLRGHLLLHRAFDAYWGGRWWGRLDAFLRRYPAYQAMAPELRDFVTASRRLFFGKVAAEPWSLARLRRLARRLAMEEIRHGGLGD